MRRLARLSGNDAGVLAHRVRLLRRPDARDLLPGLGRLLLRDGHTRRSEGEDQDETRPHEVIVASRGGGRKETRTENRYPRAALSALPIISVAYAGVHAYLCAYYCTLYARRSSEREYLVYGILAASLSAYNVGCALLATAPDSLEGELGQKLQHAMLPIAVAFYLHFVLRLVGRRSDGWLRAAYVVGVLGMAAAVAGLDFDPSRPLHAPAFGIASAPLHPRGELTAVAYVSGSFKLLFAAYALWVLVQAAKTDRDARAVAAASALAIFAAVNDFAIAAGLMRSYPLLEHATMLWNVAVSNVLLGRFVRAGDDLQTRTRELRQSYDDLRHTQEELSRKESLATVGELSAVVAHEVRNPLAIIKNAVSGLRRRTLKESDREILLQIVDEETDRLNRLVSDLLAFARPISLDGRPVALRELVDRALESAKRGAPGSDVISTKIELEGAIATVHGDPELLRHALVNVIDNAVQAMPRGGTLTVRARAAEVRGEAGVALEITDTGEGMDTLVRQKARDPFFTTRPAGTGLGLAIVERLVRAHGGAVEIESSHGSGTTVTLLIPQRRPTTSIPPAPR